MDVNFQNSPLFSQHLLYRIALLTALSCVLQISESMIPHPIPGLRLGLANMITLIALVRLGFPCALEIAVFRTILSSLVIGTFMSPAFILSISGAITSTVFMGGMIFLFRVQRLFRPSIIGISIMGALVHNMVQLYAAYFILIRHDGIFVFLPWLCFGAVVMGWVTGKVAVSVLKQIDSGKEIPEKRPVNTEKIPPLHIGMNANGGSFLHRIPPELKIGVMTVLACLVIFFDAYSMFAIFYFMLAVMILFSRLSFSILFSKLIRFRFLLAAAFFLPVVFNDGSQIVFQAAYLTLTAEGLHQGSVLLLRMIFLITMSAVFMTTTSPAKVTAGLSRLLRPLGYLGGSPENVAKTLSLSLEILPLVWEKGQSAIREGAFSDVRNLKHLLPLLSNFVGDLYLSGEKGVVIPQNHDVEFPDSL